jgi:two-component system sensor histidine kinase DesK
MNARSTPPTAPWPRDAWQLLVALHAPFIVFAIAQPGFSLALPPPSNHGAAALALVLVASALQLRHSLAAARGTRPRYWQWSLLLLVAIVYVPAPWFGIRWMTLQWFALASFAMLTHNRVLVVAILAGDCAWCVVTATANADPSLVALLGQVLYFAAVQLLGVVGLYGATRLVRLHDELRTARAGLADLAMGRERLRISRDLHDVLGQSLTAVSLKGDLAIGLLERDDVPRAIAEIDSLIGVARAALRDVLDIAHREPPIALSSEIDRMVDLLASTGTETRVDAAAGPLPPAIEELFAWALREGMTNVLRHSSATTCSICIARSRGTVRLEIINDGAMPVTLGGSGLNGLAARAAQLSGTANGRSSGDGRFQLTVEVPEVAT